MAKVIIDGLPIEVADGTTILNAARQIGGDIVPPAMCYYSKLQGSGGKCRTCLVRAGTPAFDPATKQPIMDETTGKQKINFMPKLVASCSTNVSEGMVVENITNPAVVEARKGVVEFLLINHPLDCPICDQAGECNLQDLAYEHGTVSTRYEEDRRVFDKIDIGEYIKLHMTRCILCYRCVYTANQLTDERVHGVLFRGDASEIGTYIERAIDNDFSGNVIDVCPVGALTDKTFRFKSRVWFLEPMNAHRDCPTCSGKAVVWMFGEEIYRITARKDKYGEVEEFICNDCRFHSKDVKDWTIEGPRELEKNSVINANHYVDEEPEHKVLQNAVKVIE
ncbi:MAG: (2Fe-2S)-binding protein [Saprospiraceae bacterium]|nr:(2Fe-2S)-binding protein [Saprospiraceae bacterium]MBP7699847.1 (2Fe-2S)-binding protein [Saprospiraceae bacterium]